MLGANLRMADLRIDRPERLQLKWQRAASGGRIALNLNSTLRATGRSRNADEAGSIGQKGVTRRGDDDRRGVRIDDNSSDRDHRRIGRRAKYRFLERD